MRVSVRAELEALSLRMLDDSGGSMLPLVEVALSKPASLTLSLSDEGAPLAAAALSLLPQASCSKPQRRLEPLLEPWRAFLTADFRGEANEAVVALTSDDGERLELNLTHAMVKGLLECALPRWRVGRD